EKWLKMNVLSEDYHQKLYHRALKSTNVLSTAIAHQKEVLSVHDFIDDMMTEATEILRSWGFKDDQFSIASN
ncbi:MAG: hypothetical protein KAX18_13390, partial [Candidatus Lokiarchaeota archaeon]|nr:hypothetical protein [Candidatus Lokiarchaeota archaeon]